jgi:protein-tyrosine phosphatase
MDSVEMDHLAADVDALGAALAGRLADGAPLVSSAGTMGLEGSGATPEGIEAARELGADISSHVARRLTLPMAEAADLVLCMASDHRALVVGASPTLASRTFTLKELVRLLETLSDGPAVGLAERVAAADAARKAGAVLPSSDDDIADPLGQPFAAYRAIAWELETWIDRLAAGLYPTEASGDAAAGGS